jgi:hypothetical protein
MRYLVIIFSFFISIYLSAQTNDTIHSFELDSGGTRIYNTADIMPEMSISQSEFISILSSKLKWPEVDTACWFDKVYFGIIIYADGSIKTNSLEIVAGNCNDDERIEKMKKQLRKNLDDIFYDLPKWIPGDINNKKVAVMYTIPIHVNLKL